MIDAKRIADVMDGRSVLGRVAASIADLEETKLLIFGSPKAGTRLMLAAPSIAIVSL